VLREIDTPEIKGQTDWLLDGIIRELRNHGIIGKDSHPNVYQTARHAASSYSMAAQDVKDGLVKGLDYEPMPNDLAALGELAAHALAKHIKKVGRAPLCLQVMLQQTVYTLSAVDDCFPGYIAAKKLGWLIRKQQGQSAGMVKQEGES
jgi:hypothetical protein